MSANKLYIVPIEETNIVTHSPVEVTIVPTTGAHIRELARTLREEDRHEILSFGISPEKALWRSYKGALIRKTALIDDKVAAIWGVGGSFMGVTGMPWLLTSDEVKRISPLRFARIYQKEVGNMLLMFPKLYNYVDANYIAAIRLLGIVGFKLSEPEIIGSRNAFFIKFEKEV